MNSEEEIVFALRTPFTSLLVAPSQAGKTTFIEKILENADKLYDRKPGKFYYFYKVWQKKYETMNAEFISGMCTMNWLKENLNGQTNCTIVLDDVADQMTSDTAVLFSVGSHHYDVNILLLLHNLFDKNKAFRQVSLNTRYLIIFKNPRDASTITHFAKQFDPGHNKRLENIYREATVNPYSYLFIDMDQMTNDKHRLRSNIFFESNEPMKIYQRL